MLFVMLSEFSRFSGRMNQCLELILVRAIGTTGDDGITNNRICTNIDDLSQTQTQHTHASMIVRATCTDDAPTAI